MRPTDDQFARFKELCNQRRIKESVDRLENILEGNSSEQKPGTIIENPSLPFKAGDFVTRTDYEREMGIKITKTGRKLLDEQYLPLIKRLAAKYSIEWQLLAAHISAESGYKLDAVSRTGAYGISQFMPGPAKDRGLVVAEGVYWKVGKWTREFPITFDPNYDERLKPEKAIDAMCRKNKGNLKKFDGDWQLAITAYNRGTRRTLDRLEDKGRDHAMLWKYVNKIWKKMADIKRIYK